MHGLSDPNGPPYTRAEARQILRQRDEDTLRRWAKAGIGPPFYREGRKHSRVLYPRREFWEWFASRTYLTQSEADADEATRL